MESNDPKNSNLSNKIKSKLFPSNKIAESLAKEALRKVSEKARTDEQNITDSNNIIKLIIIIRASTNKENEIECKKQDSACKYGENNNQTNRK
jgi:hypothetical protein